MLRLQPSFVDPDQFLPLSGVLAETVIGNAIQPGGKFRLPAKTPDVFVSTEKSLLSKIVGQGQVASRELAQKTAHGRLMIANQLSEGVVVILEKNPGNEIGVIERHSRSLHLGGSFFLVNVEAPDQEIAEANDERNEA